MKKGGSSKSSKQQAAIAISMKAAGKKPKMQVGGEKKSSMSSLDSMRYYGNQFDSLSAEAAKKLGTGKDASKDLKGASKARANETRIAKKIYGTGPGVPQKKMGGSLKSVDSSKNPGLAKLPTEVRNKMGYQKYGGSTKMKMGGSCGTPKSLSKKK